MEKLENLNNLKKLRQKLFDWKKITEEEKNWIKQDNFMNLKLKIK